MRNQLQLNILIFCYKYGIPLLQDQKEQLKPKFGLCTSRLS